MIATSRRLDDTTSTGRWLVFAVVASTVFMSNLDQWIVNVAFVDIGKDLGGSVSALSWVLNAYTITLAALLVPAGRWGDRVGHRQLFLASVAVFTLASLLCAAAPSLPLLVAARVLQAAGAAAQLPTSLALLMSAVATQRRTQAVRQWSAVGSIAAVCGPVLGGLLVTLDWRWVFIVNVPVGLVAVVVGWRVLPRDPAREREPLPDLFGTVLLTVGVATLTGAVVEAPDWGWGSGGVLGLLGLAVASLVWFGWRCVRQPRPILELDLLRVRRVAVANAGMFAFSAGFAIMLVSNSLWCQNVWHWSALSTGLAMAPGPLMVPIVTQLSTRLAHRVGLGPLIVVGSVLFAGGMLWRVAFASGSPDYVRDLLPSMIVGGAGVGLAFSSLIAVGATALPDERAATASGMINFTRQVASCFGVATLVTVLAGAGGVVQEFRAGWWIGAGLAIAAAVIGLGLFERRTSAPGGDPVVGNVAGTGVSK